MAIDSSSLWNLMSPIHGQDLSSVVFVRDYFQLVFDGPTINVTGLASIEVPGYAEVGQADQRFPGLLRDLIGKEVSGAETDSESTVALRFGGHAVVRIQFPPDGGEAIYFHDHSTQYWFVLPS